MRMKFKDKKETLHFLKGLMKGDRSLRELRQHRSPFLLAYSNHPGRYKELENGKYWTDKDIEVYELRYPGDKVFLFFQTDEEGSQLEKGLTNLIRKGGN